MGRSKLELSQDVLDALCKKPLTLDGVCYKCQADCKVLGKLLDFLVANSLVEAKRIDDELIYTITKRGISVLKTLKITKSLEKLQAKQANIPESFSGFSGLA